MPKYKGSRYIQNHTIVRKLPLSHIPAWLCERSLDYFQIWHYKSIPILYSPYIIGEFYDEYPIDASDAFRSDLPDL